MKDIHSLNVLYRLLTLRSVTRTAEELALTQSAISHALKKLRQNFNDELLVRVGPEYHLTEKAERLLPLLARTFDELSSGLRQIDMPEGVPDRLRIGIEDYCELQFGDKILSAFRALNPDVRVNFTPFPDDNLEDALLSRRIDMGIGVASFDSSTVMKRKLLTDRFVTACHQQHPLAETTTLTLEEFVRYPHAMVSAPQAGQSLVDSSLEREGLSRKVAYSAAYFLSCPFILRRHDMLMTGSQILLKFYADWLPIVLKTPPLALPGYDVCLFWHRKDNDSASHTAMRQCIYALNH